MIIEVKAGVRASNKEPRAIVLEKMIKVSSTSSTNDDRKPEINRGKALGVDDRTDFNRPLQNEYRPLTESLQGRN